MSGTDIKAHSSDAEVLCGDRFRIKEVQKKKLKHTETEKKTNFFKWDNFPNTDCSNFQITTVSSKVRENFQAVSV